MAKTKSAKVSPDRLAKIISHPDLTFSGSGSVYLLIPHTDAGREWIDQNVYAEDYQYIGSGIAVEWRYVDDIANGAMNDGLTVA